MAASRRPRNGTTEPGPSAAAGDEEEQSLGQRRILRSNYRSLQTVIQKDKDGVAQTDPRQFTSLISSMNNLYNRADRPRELIADAEAVYDISTSLLTCVKRLSRKSGTSPGEFVAALINKFGNGTSADEDEAPHIDWISLAVDAATTLPEAPGLSTMIGPMANLTPKKRKVATYRKREKPGPSTRPEEVVEEENKKTETDKNMETMFTVLRKNKRVKLANLLLNRNSFAQTVENLFALSFLVKDGRAQMVPDEQGECFVVPKNAPSGEDRARGKVQNSQFVFRFDFLDWKFMQENVEQGAEAMPHRCSEDAAAVRKTSRNRARETCSVDDGEDEPMPRKKSRL